MELREAVFEGHLAPPDGEKHSLRYRFLLPIDGSMPKEVKNQRKILKMQYGSDVQCIKATCTVRALGLKDEEVVVSVDPESADGSRLILLQSPKRPDLGLTVLRLEAGGDQLIGGDETWTPDQTPIIQVTRKVFAAGEETPPQKPKTAAGAGPRARNAALKQEDGSKKELWASPPRAGPQTPRSGAYPLAAPASQAEPPLAPPVQSPPPALPPSSPPRSPEREWTMGPGGVSGGVGRSGMNVAGLKPLQRPSGAKAEVASDRPDILANPEGVAAPAGGPALGLTGADLDKQIHAAKADAAERLVSAAAAGETGDVIKVIASTDIDCVAPAGGRHEGQTPLMAATERGRSDVVDLLLGKKADLEFADAEGRTAVMHAVHAQRKDVLQQLLNAKASAQTADTAGMTALMVAVAAPRPEIAAALLKAGAKRESHDAGGHRAMHHAAKSGRAAAMMSLLAAKAQIDPRDADGLTPFLASAAAGRTESVKMLLANRADASATDSEGRTAKKLASIHDQGRVLQALAEAGA